VFVFAFIRDIWNSPHSSWILLCVLVGVSAFAWHEVTLHEAVAAAHQEDKAAIDAANAKAQAAHDAKQTEIDQAANSQNLAISLKVDAISREQNAISAKLSSLKPTVYKTALPKDCQFDDERIRDANDALQH
jgi:hypothetical protein